MYPRLYRLGLIEAAAKSFFLISDERYPRLYRLGLIEANHPDRSASAGLPGIRGVIASASLKQQAKSLGLEKGRAVSEALLPRPH